MAKSIQIVGNHGTMVCLGVQDFVHQRILRIRTQAVQSPLLPRCRFNRGGAPPKRSHKDNLSVAVYMGLHDNGVRSLCASQVWILLFFHPDPCKDPTPRLPM